jgi:hypothetical protein
MKSQNGKKILPRGTAVRITPERIGKIEDGTVAGRMSTAGYKKMFGPQGPMMVKLSGGNVVDIQSEEQGVAEAGDTAKGQKMLAKVHQRAADRVTSKQADKDPAYARKAQQTQDRAWDRLAVKEQGVAEEQHSCPHCGGEMVSEELMNEKKDACYYKVKSRYKVWPSAYASGALVKCRKKGADSWGNGGKKNESSILEGLDQVDENLHKWFKEKWVRFGPDGKIRGACARGDDSEGKPKCLPQSKAHSLGKKGRASAAARKRREDPNPERSGKAINVNTKKKTNENFEEESKMQFNELGINEDWQKVNKSDKTDGMSRKAVKAYRRENPGSKLKTAVTTKPSKLKKGSKSAKRRKSFCARMKGMKKAHASAKTKRNPDSPINKALRRWNCESIEQMQELVMIAEQKISQLREAANPAQQAAIAISMKKAGKKPKNLKEGTDMCTVCGQTPCNCTHGSSIMQTLRGL